MFRTLSKQPGLQLLKPKEIPALDKADPIKSKAPHHKGLRYLTLQVIYYPNIRA